MLTALAFRQPDVDAFLSSISHEQYVEWEALFHLHPQGWTALNRVATRLSYMIAQSTTPKQLDESIFMIQVPIPKGDMPNATAQLAEAQRIHHEQLTALKADQHG